MNLCLLCLQPKYDKTNITRTIYDIMCQSGSRFLRHNETLDHWEELSTATARDKIGHALRFANRVSRQKSDSNFDSSKLTDKPEGIHRSTQPFVSSQAPAHSTNMPMILQVQPIDQTPLQINIFPTSDLVLEQKATSSVLCSSFAPVIHGIDVQTIMPRTLAECHNNEETSQAESSLPTPTLLMIPCSVAPSVGIHPEAQKEGLFPSIDPSCLEDDCVISFLHRTFVDSINSSNNLGGHNDEEFDAFEQGDLTAHWDFDAEILSVLC